MDSTLRPRDIQARIRAGETPEAVAAGRPDHRRQDHAVRRAGARRARSTSPTAPSARRCAAGRRRRRRRRRRTLGDAVAGHLRSLNVDPETVEWDAWRREDGRWTLTGEFVTTRRNGHAPTFTYDAPGNYVIADNDDARWLVGERGRRAAEPPSARDDLQQARQRRLSAVPEDELPLGDDAIELVPSEDADRLAPSSRSRRS